MSAEIVTIKEEGDVGQRIDNFLLRQLKGVPRTHVYKILRSGEVRVNSGRIKPSYRLSMGDQVRVPPVRIAKSTPIRPQSGLIERLQDAILFEDDRYLAIDKPAGVAVHGGTSINSGVVEQLRLAANNPKLELVHRLDRDTSGCLLLAKRGSALREAQTAFRQRTTSKIYQGLVQGQWPKSLRSIQLPLQRYQTSWGERRVRVDYQGQSARTDVELLSATEEFSSLRLILHTGRTHQIRVHLAHHGHPLLGDSKYGDEQSAERLMLHAERLKVRMPNGELDVRAPLPDSFLQKLG